jgi:pimeloyl-ACP methyl ester carboxylesterase
MLFGVYHPPNGRRPRDIGVVLCYPLGQEYIRSHRAFLRLAAMLSSRGFHVLRFDYSGSGDSEGDSREQTIDDLIDDISAATDELKGGSGAGRICLVGLRLGGALSVLAGIRRGGVDAVVLWDPVVDGAAHLEHLRSLHEEWLSGSFAEQASGSGASNGFEALGFPLGGPMLADLKSLDLLGLREKPADEVFLVTSVEPPECVRLKDHLQGIVGSLTYGRIPAPEVWIKKDDDMAKGLVPIQVLEAVSEWIEGAF